MIKQYIQRFKKSLQINAASRHCAVRHRKLAIKVNDPFKQYWKKMSPEDKMNIVIQENTDSLTDPEEAFMQGEGFTKLEYYAEALMAYEKAIELDEQNGKYCVRAKESMQKIYEEIKSSGAPTTPS